jgi:hypothetical protein
MRLEKLAREENRLGGGGTRGKELLTRAIDSFLSTLDWCCKPSMICQLKILWKGTWRTAKTCDNLCDFA